MPYLSQMRLLEPVDQIVDNSQLIHRLEFSTEFSTALSTDFTPLIHRFIHNPPRSSSPSAPLAVHSLKDLSTELVDKSARLWTSPDGLSTISSRLVDELWTDQGLNACWVLQSSLPGGKGARARQASTLAFNEVGNLVYLAKRVALAVYEVAYLRGGVHDGRVVATAEGFPYLGEGFVGELAGEVHGDLARVGERFRAARADEVGLRDTEVAAHLVLDELDRDLAVRLVRQDVPEDLLGQGHGHLSPVERGVGEDAHQGPFELPDIRRDLRGDERQHLVVYLEAVHDRLLAQDGDARLEVRGLDVGYQPPLEPAHETVLQGLYVLGVPVGGDNDMLVLLVERVEGVEERLLRLHLVLQKLYVVHQEHVVLAVALLELQGRVIPHGVYEVVGELLTGHVTDAHAGVLI